MNRQIQGTWGEGVNREDMAKLVEQGRRLHSEAVFAVCVRLIRPFKGLTTGREAPVVAARCQLRTR